MKRRNFLGYGAAAGFSGAFAGSCGKMENPQENTPPLIPTGETPPSLLGGMNLEGLWEDHRVRLFDRLLPFWEIGGIDREYGGYLCFLNDDGQPVGHDKFTRHQGRGLWVYSYLYNNFGNDSSHLENAAKTRDFMVKYMYAGNGTWAERTSRDGKVGQGTNENITTSLVAASGLIEFFKATGNPEDLDIVGETIWSASRAYDRPEYTGESYAGIVNDPEITSGIRSLGHTIAFINLLTLYLSYRGNRRFEDIVDEQVAHAVNDFYAPHLRITTEYLQHNYTVIPGLSDHMYVGHSLELLVMVMYEAARKRNRRLFDEVKDRFRLNIEMCWDYNLDGLGSQHYFVFDGPHHTRHNLYGAKTMKVHADALTGLMKIIEHTGEHWAVEWFDRIREYTLKTFDTPTGLWNQVVNRAGKETNRADIIPVLRDNYTQARCLMLCIKSLEHMIDNGTLTRI
jgi:mannose/cellobiose epimerase-like protein (N-acyl-D-glucosamine 2-epimerase family)